ncbi:MAG: hypothetical protein IT573_00125 [Deltaproteobacteria bacterium]|nr:hypothetical protein [Deltaproteobacteria bacterium]
MTHKVPPPAHPEIRPGSVLGSESLPFESLIFSNDSAGPAAGEAAAPASSRSRYVSGEDPARRVAETPRPAFSKLFRPQS